jgi:hypothetical protein
MEIPDTSRLKKLSVSCLLFVFTAFVYSRYGFWGKLHRDDALYIYGGRRLAEGIAPYLGIFDFKGPITPMVTGVGVALSNWLGWDDVYTVRLLFLFISSLAVVAIYQLGKRLFQSERVGVFAALTCLGFFGFAKSAASGPRPKTLVVLFGTLSLLLTGRKMWFWAGLFGALSALTWQPAGIFLLVTLLVAAMQPRKERLRAISLSLFGIGVPSVALAAYFISQNAFGELLDGILLFHLRYMTRPPSTLISHLTTPLINIFKSYRMMFLPIAIGSGMVFYLYFWRRSLHNSLKDMLAGDEFSPLLISFPLFVMWSALDFQGGWDFFVFLPYVAIGFAWFLDIAVDGVKKYLGGEGRGWALRFITPAICVALAGSAWLDLHINSEDGYLEQVAAAAEIERRFGKDVKLYSLGIPEVLVVMRRVNPTPYIVVLDGIDRQIHASTPQGFTGWVGELIAYDPDLIAMGPTGGKYIDELAAWVTPRYHREQIGPWLFYVRNSPKAGQ